MVSVRPKGDKIGMWLGDSTAGDSIINIGKKVKERLMIDNQVSSTERKSHLLQIRELY